MPPASSSIEAAAADGYSMMMTQQRPAEHELSTEWKPIFDSCRPLRILYSQGEMICQLESYLAGIHLIVKGVVSDMIPSTDTEQPNCNILAAGDLIGLEILERNPDGLSISLCRALTTVELLFVEKRQFTSYLDDHPVLQQSLLRYAVSRYVSARKDPRQQAPVEARLCRLLLRLGETCGIQRDNGMIALPAEITLRTLGDLLSISSRRLRQAIQAIHRLNITEAGIQFDQDEALRIIDGCCTPE